MYRCTCTEYVHIMYSFTYTEYVHTMYCCTYTEYVHIMNSCTCTSNTLTLYHTLYHSTCVYLSTSLLKFHHPTSPTFGPSIFPSLHLPTSLRLYPIFQSPILITCTVYPSIPTPHLHPYPSSAPKPHPHPPTLLPVFAHIYN